MPFHLPPARRSTLIAALAVSFVATAPAQPRMNAVIGGAGQEYANAVTTDAAGNTYVAGLTYSPDFPVTPGAYQTTFGRTCDAFVAKLDPGGKVLWATYLGGILDDSATGIALDSAGNVIVAGWTRSADFPVTNAFQKTLNNGASPGEFDGFVAKLDPTGSKLLYSTFLGGPLADMIFGLALDSAGNAYVTGNVGEAAGFPGLSTTARGPGIFVSKLDPQGALLWSFLRPLGSASGIAIDTAGNAYVAASDPGTTASTLLPSDPQQAMVFKVSADGKRELFEKRIGGSSSATATAVAIGRDGSIYLGGATDSVDFPLVKPLQSTLGARPLWKTTDAGTTWLPIDDLPFAYPAALVSDPSAPNTLYVATSDAGVLKSTDGGATWTKLAVAPNVTSFTALGIDPKHPQTLYAGSAERHPNLYKTVDGGITWKSVDEVSSSFRQILVDAQNSNIVYTVRTNVARKTTDGGVSWSDLPFNGNSLTFLAVDPAVSGNLFAFSPLIFGGGGPGAGDNSKNPYIWHSTDGGANWTMIPSPIPAMGSGMLIDPTTTPSTVYNGIANRSLDNGATFSPLPSSPPDGVGNTGAVAVDSVGTLYANIFGGGIYTSRDRGQTWSPLGKVASPVGSRFGTTSIIAIVPTANTSTLYTLVRNPQTSGFIARLSPDGINLLFSTYLRSHISFAYDVIFAAEPGVVSSQNQITALALDSAGNVVAAGQTRGNDFPVVNPSQSANAGLGDAFIATIAADGSKLLYGTYIGGSRDDAALGLSTDAQGNITIAGQTFSGDFPGGVKPPAGQIGDAFVVRLPPPGPPIITAVQNAASNQPGIESGSWVAIKGSHLANTDPGRIWKDEEVVNGNLPTSLDGVSVTINGKPAFVYYISPTQINVQAPTDPATGPVDVVVNNNGAISAAFTAQLQTIAPAFFTYLGTSTAIATRLPDYSQTVKPGDPIVLWATGFGPTITAAPAGVAVTGAPAVLTTPVVTIGGIQVLVVSAGLTTGTAGLYQITVQLPANIPTGAQPLQAAVGSIKTPTGITLTISQ